MGDPARTVTERVVEDPATRATTYGDTAVQQGVRVAQGGKPKAAPKKAPAAPTEPAHVLKARALWKAAFGKDAQLANVRIGDLKAHSDRNRAKRPDVGKLHGVEYQAWTNSSRDVYVNTTLVMLSGTTMPDWYPEAFLRHEAIHVRQFAATADAVPTYLAMIKAEASAYAETVRWLDGVTWLPAEKATYDAVYDALEVVVTGFTDRSKVTATELEHKAWMVTEKYLPEHTPSAEPVPRPLSLYVR
ncbi:MAG: hypothetical protein H0U28_12410 [Nocardioidaceae bacterium]|nr:hypothetical protein [Nocardioidaceae bacterium]